jgi:chorismate mutase-like protein
MKESNQERAKKLLKPYRQQIDDLDNQILELLGARFKIVKKVAAIKSKHDIPSFLHDRVVEVRERCAKIGKRYGIDPDFVRILYSTIIYQSCTIEDEIKHRLWKKK